MKLIRFETALIAAVAFASVLGNQPVQASQGRGGGDAMVCKGFVGLINNKRSTLADLTQKDSSIVPPTFFDYLTRDELEDKVNAYLAFSAAGLEVLKAEAQLHFNFKPEISNLNTGFKPSLAEAIIKGCRKVQLAAQDPLSNEVDVDLIHYDELANIEKILLKKHEAYVHLGLSQHVPYLQMESLAREKTLALYKDLLQHEIFDSKCHGPFCDVAFHLRQVLFRWSGALPNGYSRDDSLESQLTETELSYAHFDAGFHANYLHRLMNAIHSDPLFKSCASANNIRVGEFAQGGDLVTVGDLYIRLLNCGLNQL